MIKSTLNSLTSTATPLNSSYSLDRLRDQTPSTLWITQGTYLEFSASLAGQSRGFYLGNVPCDAGDYVITEDATGNVIQTGDLLFRSMRNVWQLITNTPETVRELLILFPYTVNSCTIKIRLWNLISNRDTITTWQQGTVTNKGNFTDGTNKIAIPNLFSQKKPCFGDFISFNNKTFSITSIAILPSNLLKVTTTTPHGFTGGELLRISQTLSVLDYRNFKVDPVGITANSFTLSSSLGLISQGIGAAGNVEQLFQITSLVGDGTGADAITLNPAPTGSLSGVEVKAIYRAAQLGLFEAGLFRTIPNASSLQLNPAWFGNIVELQGGQTLSKSGNLRRDYRISANIPLDEFRELEAFYIQQQGQPFPCNILSNMAFGSWLALYATIPEPPSSEPFDKALKYLKVNFQLKEKL